MNKFKINYSGLISKLSHKVYHLHKFKLEWKIPIILIFLARIFTSCISIYAGYSYFIFTVNPFFNSLIFSVIISIIFLIFLELLTIIFLEKTFKFLIRGKFKIFFLPLLTALILFSLSFFISTSGLALKGSSNVDLTKNINSKYLILKNQENLLFDENKKILNKQIKLIIDNPEGWQEGIRCILTKNQQNRIDSLFSIISVADNIKNEKLSLLDDKKNKELSNNKIKMISSANKYYNFILIIMIIQFLCNFAIVFFYSKIYNFDNEEAEIKEQVKETSDVIFSNIFNLLFNRLTLTTNYITEQLELENKKIESSTLNIQNSDNNNNNNNNNNNSDNNIITGFNNNLNSNNKRKKNNPKINFNINYNFIRKHSIISRFILNNYSDKTKFLTNKNVKHIQNNIKNAHYQSETTIKKVFNTISSIGFNNIDIKKI